MRVEERKPVEEGGKVYNSIPFTSFPPTFVCISVPPTQDVRRDARKRCKEAGNEEICFLRKKDVLSSEPSSEATAVYDDSGTAGLAVSQLCKLTNICTFNKNKQSVFILGSDPSNQRCKCTSLFTS